MFLELDSAVDEGLSRGSWFVEPSSLFNRILKILEGFKNFRFMQNTFVTDDDHICQDDADH